jgi:Protein of unknown function (DUF4242)
MPRYLVERRLGNVTEEQVRHAADHATAIREARFPEIGWEHSHVVRTAEGLVAYCVYDAPTERVVHAHAAAAGLPSDQVHEIVVDLRP